jgi:hypothetical protein
VARLDLPDVRRDEDLQTSRRGGITRSDHYDVVRSFSEDELFAIAEAALVVSNALERIVARGGDIHSSTVAGFASLLKVGLRPSGRPRDEDSPLSR